MVQVNNQNERAQPVYSLEDVMDAKHVVVVGASRDPSKPGARLLKVLLDTGFSGRIAGVNPRSGRIHGVELYSSIEEVPFDIDIAVLLIPPASVPAVMEDCARKGAKGVVIASEGFAEAGPGGARYQEAVREVLRRTALRAFGPNTLGVINTSSGLTTSYYTDPFMLRPGSIGIAAQSGIFVGALLRYLASTGLWISKAIGLGNKVDVDESDALDYLLGDRQTETVGLYLEDIRDGRRFLDAARGAVRRKPILLIKGGRSPAGRKAIASHTASLAVNDAVLEGALHQAGVLRMTGIEELICTLMGFQWMPMPRGNRIALVTYSGAQAILCIDQAVKAGLELAVFSERTRRRLSKVIEAPYKTENPIDIFPAMAVRSFEELATEVLAALLEDSGVHGIIFISFVMDGAEMYQPAIDLIGSHRAKPVFFSLFGAKDDVTVVRDLLMRHCIPFIPFPELSVRVFANMWGYADRFRGN